MCTWAHVGANGSASDAGMFKCSSLRESTKDSLIGFLDPEPLSSDDAEVPYFFIKHDVFPLCSWLMKPYSHRYIEVKNRIFIYRLSQTCQVVENAFGIL